MKVTIVDLIIFYKVIGAFNFFLSEKCFQSGSFFLNARIVSDGRKFSSRTNPEYNDEKQQVRMSLKRKMFLNVSNNRIM